MYKESMQTNISFGKVEAVKSLQDLVNKWMDLSPARSVAALARSSSVSDSSLRRLMNDNVLPSNENVGKIMHYLLGATKNRDLVENNDQTVVDLVKFVMPFKAFEAVKDYSVIAPSVEEALDSSTKQLIFAKASVGKGIMKQEILEDFGKLGIKASEDLLKKGLLISSGEVFTVTPECSKHSISLEMTKEILSLAIQTYYKPETDTNFVHATYDSVSKQGYGQIMDVYMKAYNDILSIIKEQPGNVPVIAGGFIDTMTTSDFFEKKGQ